jgi:hypothetical protein
MVCREINFEARLTFLADGDWLFIWWVLLGFAHALDVYLFRFAEFTTVFALGDGTALLLYLEKRAICVFAGGGAMTFDTSFTVGTRLVSKSKGERRYKDIPGIFLIAYKDLKRGKVSEGEERILDDRKRFKPLCRRKIEGIRWG